MRILVTGITGQIGSAVAARLNEFGTIVPADRATLDLSCPSGVASALDRLSPDVIVNPAAYTAVDRAEDEPDAAFRVNAEGPSAVAAWAAARRVPLVQFSTDYVFDGTGDRPWREDDEPRPLSVYGASKLAGEEAVRAACGPHLIVRTSWVYAAAGTNFLQTMTRMARKTRELRVVTDQFGAPTPADVVAAGLADIFRRHAGNLAGGFAAAEGLVHLCARGCTSWHGFAEAIVRGLRRRGVRLAVERVTAIATADRPTRARRPLNCRLDLSRLQASYRVVPPTWEAALEEQLDTLVSELD